MKGKKPVTRDRASYDSISRKCPGKSTETERRRCQELGGGKQGATTNGMGFLFGAMRVDEPMNVPTIPDLYTQTGEPYDA